MTNDSCQVKKWPSVNTLHACGWVADWLPWQPSLPNFVLSGNYALLAEKTEVKFVHRAVQVEAEDIAGHCRQVRHL